MQNYRLEMPSSRRVLALICFVFALAVIVPDQSLETHRFTAQKLLEYFSPFSKSDGLTPFMITLASLGAFSLEFFVIARLIDGPAIGRESRVARFVVPIICAAPIMATAIGFVLARIDYTSSDFRHALETGAVNVFEQEYDPLRAQKMAALTVSSQIEINWWLGLIASILAIFALLVFSAVFLSSRGRTSISRRSAIPAWAIAIVLLIPVAISVMFAVYPVEIARSITPFGVICLFFMVLTLVVSVLSLVSAQTEWPVTILLVGFAVLISIFGINNNHHIRTMSKAGGESRSADVSETIAQGFERWFSARKDKERYDVYPIYIVATEGGGIYAAHRTATLLGDLQDMCPRFSHHLFAISSVSGGSVGAAIFNGLTREISPKNDRFETKQGCFKNKDINGLSVNDVADEILQDDFLSPVLAGFLFPDFLQKFLPYPVGPFDRARALEKALEASWNRRTAAFRRRYKPSWISNGNPLGEPFSRHWGADGDSPALFFNTTEVASGRGGVISPFRLQTAQFSSLQLGSSDGEMPLSTAAVLSARFPWLTPSGWLRTITPSLNQSAAQSMERTVSLVDGGYFDNSGVITAQAIINEIETAVKAMTPQPKIKINLIVLTSEEFADPPSVAGDYLVPFETLLSTRAARGRIAVEQAEKLFEAQRGGPNALPNQSFEKAELQGFGYSLPLGWRLSELTRLLILGQNGDRVGCTGVSEGQIQKTASCLKASIYQEMSK